MNYKVEYITRLFQKTSKKRIEHYCLTRLWHNLDNDEIKMIPQQYVGRHQDKYALTDVFFPQFKIHVEVNEPAHYSTNDKINADRARKQEIERNTGHKLYTIDCRKDLKGIHSQIDDIVKIIKEEYSNHIKGNLFKSWDPDTESNPNYWKKIGKIKTSDNVWFHNIEDICTAFNADFNKTKRGFLRRGAINHPNGKNYIIWWPSGKVSRAGWINILNEDKDEIIESNSDLIKNEKHFNNHYKTPQRRITFFHQKDILGLTSYKFLGVFEFDIRKSNKSKGVVWRQAEDELMLDLSDK